MFFKRGVHPKENKITEDTAITKAVLPKKVIIPLQQHIGAPCKPLVKVGDIVKKYQKIAQSDAPVSAPIHASISGKIIKIQKYLHILGKEIESITIESDEKDEGINISNNDVEKLSKNEILKIIKDAGIVGLGGATFPTHIKLNPPKKIDTIILNGCECEPYITADDRLMRENAEKIIKGLSLIKKVVDAKNAIIAVEDNKQEAITAIKLVLKDPQIKIKELVTRYPQGAEKTLIKKIIGKEVPSGGLPMDLGVVVSNVATAYAIYDAVFKNMPLIRRVITVTGDVNKPQNILARVGTPIKDLIDQCGGYIGKPKKIIAGGPMMGISQYTDEVPIIKGTNCILVFSKYDEIEHEPCIRCSRCVDVCPAKLLPTTIAQLSEKEKYDESKKFNPLDCVECGCCDYICPTKRPLVSLIKIAKGEILKK